MNGMSPWALSASLELANIADSLFDYTSSDFNFAVYLTRDSVWIVVKTISGGSMSFRAAFGSGTALSITKATVEKNQMQAWELTKEKRYLKEAEKAALSLQGYGFEVFYQANNTAFASGALLRLYNITRNDTYLNLSYMCLAGIFRNTQLWDCNYGYGKNFPRFFALYPLNDAPYTAVYEEQEVFCA